MNLFGIDLARLDELLGFGDRDLPRHSAQRVEVARRFVKDEVSVPVADARTYQREVAYDPFFEHVGAPVEISRLLLRRSQGDQTVGLVAPRQSAVGDLRPDDGP